MKGLLRFLSVQDQSLLFLSYALREIVWFFQNHSNHRLRSIHSFSMIASMSRKGDCYDNAPMESFWGILKTELVHHRRFKTRQQAIQEITEYIEIFYNRQRKQEKLGYLSPAQFSKQYYANLLAA